ncbi:phosphotransferase [Actinomadura sp. WMMB 499]|uniref:phosphotransferase n=1 Tax=Actinomadura sp. WMMB 499 TaxID=1219491 RepID=UPI001247C568|nr:phosphotransferase [Actinomadura sp. WMMB 499]QFG24734.1 phosphotransferase [Actinomadura sp. WMMB 499]
MSDAAGPWVETVADLWPGAEVAFPGGGSGPADRELCFLPNASAPRLLLPAGRPGVAAAALRRYSHDLTAKQRAARAAGAAAARTGLPGRTLRDRITVRGGGPSVEDRLGEILGRDVVTVIGLGPAARANRKPILHALTPKGRAAAFVKVGDNAATRALIADEAAALGHLAERGPLPGVDVPRVLHHGEWNGMTLLVLSPLPTSARGRRPRAEAPVEAMRALAGLDGLARERLAETAFWESIRATPAALGDPARAARLTAVTKEIEARHGALDLDFGAWHGDWTPWNMAWHRGVLRLWDWERFERRVPLGFDLVHYRLQERTRRPGPSPYERRPGDAPDVLAPLGLPAAAAEAVLDLYLLALCCRYQRGGAGPRGEAVRAQADGLLDLLAAHTAQPSGGLS